MSIKSKMTLIADKIRLLLGISDTMGLDGMASNLDLCQEEIDEQADLLEIALAALDGKMAGSESTKIELQNKSVTPSSVEQVVTADVGFDGLSQVLVSGDSDLVSGNIKNGISIFGITGIYVGENGAGSDMNTSDATATEEDIASGATAYVNGQKITGTIPIIDSYECYSSGRFDDNLEYLTCDYMNFDGRLILEDQAVITYKMDTYEFGDATPEDVLEGKTFTSINGMNIIGTRSTSDDLPNGILKIASGTFSVNNSTTTYVITHNFNVVPNYLNIVSTDDLTNTDYSGYVAQYDLLDIDINLYGDIYNLHQTTRYGDESGVIIPESNSLADSSVFSENTVSINLDKPFKPGTTYRWICAAIDY